jgi:hypothetical protein
MASNVSLFDLKFIHILRPPFYCKILLLNNRILSTLMANPSKMSLAVLFYFRLYKDFWWNNSKILMAEKMANKIS